MKAAAPEDRSWIEKQLSAEPHLAMFPIANLRQHGWESSEPRAMRFWLNRERGLLMGMTVEGLLMPVTSGAGYQPLPRLLSGLTALGAMGPTGPVRELVATLGLEGVSAKRNEDELQYMLDLESLEVPEGPGDIVPIDAIDRDLLIGWRAAYLCEALGESATESSSAAERDVERWLSAESHRILLVDGRSCALTGFNAALQEIVQIGGVWTPPKLRGRGYARRAVALHLAEARRNKVKYATLFSLSAAAIRTYEAIGFERIGTFSLVLFDGPVAIPAPGTAAARRALT